MTFDSAYLQSRLQSLLNDRAPSRWLVAFSGGLDSTVLLHALCPIRGCFDVPIVAIYVNHGLDDASAQWAGHCKTVAGQLGVEFVCLEADVQLDAGKGLEAAAREARYAVLGELVAPGDCLLTAHHVEDQAETLMLNLLRGSNVAGLAGIGEFREFGDGWLIRPLLDVPHADIVNYANFHELEWLTDPSNDDVKLDRNFLRHEVFPVLAQRWPAVSRQFSQSAKFAGESSALQGDLAAFDLLRHPAVNRLSLQSLQRLSCARQRNLIRHAIHKSGLSAVPVNCVRQVIDELIPARPDAQPLVSWAGGEVRRYRNHLFLLPNLMALQKPPEQYLMPDGAGVDLGPGMGLLRLSGNVAGGIDPQLAKHGLTVRFRQGGERIRPLGQSCTHTLKKLLQQKGVLPWMRDRLPLLYSESRLVAVADLWIDAESAVNHGLGVRWQNPPTCR